MKKHIYAIAIIGGFLFASCSSDNQEKHTNNEAPIEVKINHSQSENIGSFAMASGKLVSKNSVNVSTRMMGYITAMNVQVGQNVRAGQSLVSINNSDIQAKGGQVNAQISQAQANYNLARKNYERFQNLYQSESASQKELDDMKAHFEMAKAGLQAAQQMKNEVNAQYKYTNITAPISGTITAKYAEQGDMANPGMPLLTIESPGALQAEVLVPEQYILQIKNGMSVNVTLKSAQKSVIGNVSEISQSSSHSGGQYLVKVNIPSSDSLLPGMFVNVQFPFKNENTTANETFQKGVVVPKSALVEKGQLTGIYTISQEKTAILRWVKIGKTHGDQVEILSGLNANEAYIISAKGKLYNGAKVTFK